MDAMDAAALEFSHLDYNSAAVHLLNAEVKVTKLESILKLAASNRMGNIVCSPLQLSVNDTFDNRKPEEIDSTNATLTAANDDNDDNASFSNVLLFIFSIVGVIFGIYSEISERNYQHKKRGGALL
jgi:hypothetical protein